MIMLKRQLKKLFVALRKESVDRNTSTLIRKMQLHQSLSARRAWIEMAAACRPARGVAVALRKESVDRNAVRLCQLVHNDAVALRKESVDRNVGQSRNIKLVSGRSPQGERG